eukprot:CAMPEP_0114354888 /NCGR_PEP_ID=MMETSP0101-20121206/19809_1 /TAXON_ID=38822 ORGANISM="Pteridomonas danica, Strain PT" /NCGR_SAMPLE_ID=MMETSP0101 /ASSEMBLY_ACC=CAM_ASM_000211 /LENGTH=522 /DNA_ID=CAMNT_0001496565 /DNA_START=18 /DNA_END=1583 /DNA_ORIENTATION=-
MGLFDDLSFLSICIVFVVIYITYTLKCWSYVEDGSMDTATSEYLLGSVNLPKNCEGVVSAVENSEFTENEGFCAEQMRKIVMAKHIPYSSLVETPETLLRCSQGIATNGGLWTRFTVQYNLFGGSIVAVGGDAQREALKATQSKGVLGCFAFTEKGAGVLSGAGVETTATFDPDAGESGEFVIVSPTASSVKNWISQGMYAEHAVILAELFVGGESKGPHLFWAEIADRVKDDKGNFVEGSRPLPRKGVTIDSLPSKTVMVGLDNAEISFSEFRIPRTALLNRFCSLERGSDGSYVYQTHLPEGVPRMLDLLIFRLLTGRIQLSEGTIAHAQYRLRKNWDYCQHRELWRGRKPKGKMMAEMPLIKAAFRDYGRTLAIINTFIANTREIVADSIRNDGFTYDTVEATCMCKFLGTGFGVDCVSALRKLMGARALQKESELDKESFLPNATSAAEGDNTIMELKVVQDIFRGRTSMLPFAMILRVSFDPRGRRAIATYFSKLARATFLGKKAIGDGQLLKDIAW